MNVGEFAISNSLSSNFRVIRVIFMSEMDCAYMISMAKSMTIFVIQKNSGYEVFICYWESF